MSPTNSDDDEELARRLAAAREELALREGMTLLGAVDEARAWIEAASFGGIAMAVVDVDEDFDGDLDGDLDAAAAAGGAGRGVRPPARLTAARGTTGRPLPRDEYASHLRTVIGLRSGADRRKILTYEEALAVSALLDELAGVYRREPLGHLARELAVLINSRLGI